MVWPHNIQCSHKIKTVFMKKHLLLTLTLGCCMAAGAQTFEQDGLTYEVTSATTVRVTKAASPTAEPLTIDIKANVENDGTTYTVTSIGEGAFKYNKATKVTLPETLDSIYYDALGTSKIAEINLPSKLKYIGAYALRSTDISEIKIPASVKYLGGSAFFTCSKLKSVTFEGAPEEYGTSIFYHCAALTTVTLPNDMTVIPDKMFMSCDKLSTINIPSGLESIGEGSFYECKSLQNVEFPSTLEEIGDEAFLSCTGITSVSLPAALEDMGTSAFAKTSISSINLDANNTNFKLVDGVLYSKDGTILYLAPMKGKTSVSMPSNCIGINGGAFWGSEVETVTPSKKLLAIDDYAFCQSSLKSFSFPNTLTFIGEQAFASTKLTGELRLPENVPMVQDGTYAGITGITSVIIPSGVKYVYPHAFNGCTSLASVTCEGSTAPELVDVYEEYDNPFYNCAASTLNIPKGTTASYKKEYWSDYFTLKEGDKGVLVCESTSPVDGSMLTKKWFDAAVDLTFGEEVTVVKEHPEVYLRQGSEEVSPELSGKLLEPDDEWNVTRQSDKKTVRVWAADYDGYMMNYSCAPEDLFAFVIPAGIVKNAAGETNERIVVTVKGYDPSTGIAETELSTSDAKEAARFNISGVRIGKGQKGIAIVKMTDGTVKKVLVK